MIPTKKRRTARLSALLGAALLAAGLVACGEEDEPAGTTEPATQARSGASGAQQCDRAAGAPAEAKDAAQKSGDPDSEAGDDGDLGNFTPKQHDDSGGGARQFRVQGGDNSVQDFGREAGGSDFEQASAALHNFLDARAVGDWTAACSFLAEDIFKSLEQLAAREGEPVDCADALGNLTPPSEVTAPDGLLFREAKAADVGSVRIEGSRAFVLYRGLEDSVMAISMTKEDGRWKVASLGAVPLS